MAARGGSGITLKTGPHREWRGNPRGALQLPVSNPPSIPGGTPSAPVEMLCRAASALGPVVVALARLQGQARWGDELAIIRGLGLMQVGGEGVVSSALASGLAAVPIGSTVFRLTLLNPLLAGVGAWLTFELALHLFPRRQQHWLQPIAALAAAWMTGMAAVWLDAANGVGGPLLGACLVLLVVQTLQGRPRRGTGVQWAMLVGLLASEARWALPPVLMGGLVALLLNGRLPSLVVVFTRLALAIGVAATCLLPSLAESLGGQDTWRLGLDLELPLPVQNGASLAADFDGYPAFLAILALLGLLISTRGRRLALPMVGTALGALLFDSPVNRLVLIALCAAISVRGLWSVLGWVQHTGLPFRAMSLRLVLVFHLCAVLMVIEGGQQRASQQQVSGVQDWSEEVFDRLPANGLLLVNSPEAAWRLWADRLTHGLRPDVVVIPSALLAHGSLAEQLLTIEPSLHRLIRDVAAEGVVSEYALAELADTRPLRVEFDASWSPRMLAHLVGDGLWFRFAPHAMGSSDRKQGLAAVEAAAGRVVRAARSKAGRDEATLARLNDDLFRHALVAAVLGERTTADRLFRRLRRIAPGDVRVRALASALDDHPRGIAEHEKFLVRQTPVPSTVGP